MYIVVGINDIPAGAINETVVYTVPKDQRIQVRQGDVIGVGWSDASPQTTWVVGGPGAAEIRWYQDSDPSDLQVGDTAITTAVQNRPWSFSAAVTEGEYACFCIQMAAANCGIILCGILATKNNNKQTKKLTLG